MQPDEAEIIGKVAEGTAAGLTKSFHELILKVLGPSATEVGLWMGAELRALRIARMVTVLTGTDRLLAESTRRRPVPLKVIVPAFEYASLEDDDDLVERWSALLANAADADSPAVVTRRHVDVLKDLTAEDARVLSYLYNAKDQPDPYEGQDGLPALLGRRKAVDVISGAPLQDSRFAVVSSRLAGFGVCDAGRFVFQTMAGLSSTNLRTYDSIALTPFGVAFVEACTFRSLSSDAVAAQQYTDEKNVGSSTLQARSGAARVRPDRAVIERFVESLRDHGLPALKVNRWPEDESPGQTEIDAIAGDFAIEHTSVDTLPEQRRLGQQFAAVLGGLEVLPVSARLSVIVPYELVDVGIDWTSLQTQLIIWIIETAPKLPDGRHEIQLSGTDLRCTAEKDSRRTPGVVLKRPAPPDDSLPIRLAAQITRKAKKLAPYKVKGYTTVLLLETEDLALMSQHKMLRAVRTGVGGLPAGVDQVWFIEARGYNGIDLTNALVEGHDVLD